MMINKERWRQLRDAVNMLHVILQGQPPECKIGFNELSVGSILNAYREGDISHVDAVYVIERLYSRSSKTGPKPDRKIDGGRK
jgi:hypothetical protein